MILRTIQSVRNRIEATDERSDRVKPGELEVPKLSVSDYRQRSSSVGTGLAVTRGVYEVGAPSCCKSRAEGRGYEDRKAAASETSPPSAANSSRCPICDGPASPLTGGACLTCRRKMDAAMDAQMKQLADDREFQRELEEALEQLDAMPPQKLRYCECCKEPFHDDYRSVCPRHHCQLWLEGEKYRRWNAELEQSIKESIHG